MLHHRQHPIITNDIFTSQQFFFKKCSLWMWYSCLVIIIYNTAIACLLLLLIFNWSVLECVGTIFVFLNIFEFKMMSIKAKFTQTKNFDDFKKPKICSYYKKKLLMEHKMQFCFNFIALYTEKCYHNITGVIVVRNQLHCNRIEWNVYHYKFIVILHSLLYSITV